MLPLQEIDFSLLPAHEPENRFLRGRKWEEGSVADRGTRPVLHPQLPVAIAARVRRVAVEAFLSSGNAGLRARGRASRATGIPFVVDVNPNCDLSQHAGMARAAAAVGIDYPSLAKLLVRRASPAAAGGSYGRAARHVGTANGHPR